MKPKNGSLNMLRIGVLLTILFLVTGKMRAGEGSGVSLNEPSVECFDPGEEGETLYSRAAEVSKTEELVVIAVYVSKGGSEKAINHAKRLAGALTKVGVLCRIIVQTHDEEGVGFSFYANGFGVYNDELGEKGVFSPRSAIRILPKVLAQHRAQVAE